MNPNPSCAESAIPSGFPETLGKAIAQSQLVACPKEFTERIWSEAMATGGRDYNGNPIRSWVHHIAAKWAWESSRANEPKNAATGKPEGKASMWEMKTKLEMRKKLWTDLDETYDRKGAFTPEEQVEYKRLKAGIAELEKQIAYYEL
jgi:hypothetical protein